MSRSVERGGGGGGVNQMWLGNIPFDATEDELRCLLSQVGRVLQVRVKYDDKGQSKGFAFCEFPDHETCHLAYQTLNNVEFRGRKLKIDYATDELRERYTPGGGGGGGGSHSYYPQTASSAFNSQSSSSASRHPHHRGTGSNSMSSSSSSGSQGAAGGGEGGGARRGGGGGGVQQPSHMKGEESSSSAFFNHTGVVSSDGAPKGRGHAGANSVGRGGGRGGGDGGGGGQQQQQQGGGGQGSFQGFNVSSSTQPSLLGSGPMMNKQGVLDSSGGGLGTAGVSSSVTSYHESTSPAIDIMEIVQTFSTTQLVQFLSDLQKLAKESPSGCRRLLEIHPALVYATLHATFLLGGSSTSGKSLKSGQPQKQGKGEGGGGGGGGQGTGGSVYCSAKNPFLPASATASREELLREGREEEEEEDEKHGDATSFSSLDDRRKRETSCSPPPEKKQKFLEGVEYSSQKDDAFSEGLKRESRSTIEGGGRGQGGGLEELEKRLLLPTAQLEQARRNRSERQQQLERSLAHPRAVLSSTEMEEGGDYSKRGVGVEDEEEASSYRRQTQLSSLSSTTSQQDKEEMSTELAGLPPSSPQQGLPPILSHQEGSITSRALMKQADNGALLTAQQTPPSSSSRVGGYDAQVVSAPPRTPVVKTEGGDFSVLSEKLQQQQGNLPPGREGGGGGGVGQVEANVRFQQQSMPSSTQQMEGGGLVPGVQAYQGVHPTTGSSSGGSSSSSSHIAGGETSGGARMLGVMEREIVSARQQRLLASCEFSYQKEGEEGFRIETPSRMEERVSVSSAVTISSTTTTTISSSSSSSSGVSSSSLLPHLNAVLPSPQSAAGSAVAQQQPPWVGGTGIVTATSASYQSNVGGGGGEESVAMNLHRAGMQCEGGTMMVMMPGQQQGGGARGQKEETGEVQMLLGGDGSQQSAVLPRGLIARPSSSSPSSLMQSSGVRPFTQQGAMQDHQQTHTKGLSNTGTATSTTTAAPAMTVSQHAASPAMMAGGGGGEGVEKHATQPRQLPRKTAVFTQASSPSSSSGMYPQAASGLLHKGVAGGEGAVPGSGHLSTSSMGSVGSRTSEGSAPPVQVVGGGGGGGSSEERKMLASQHKVVKTCIGAQSKDPQLALKHSQSISIEFPATASGRGVSPTGRGVGGVGMVPGSAEHTPRQMSQKLPGGAALGRGGQGSSPSSAQMVSGDASVLGGERKGVPSTGVVGGGGSRTPSRTASEVCLSNAAVLGATQMSPSGISRGGIGFVSNSIASNNTSTDMLAGGGGGICGARSNGVMASTGGNTAAPAASPNATCASSSEDSFPTKLPRNQQRLSSLIQQGGLITPSKRPSSGNSSHRGSGSSSSSSTGSGASPSVITHQTPASASVGSGGVSPYRASPHLSSQTSSTGGAGKGGGGGSASSSSSSVQAVVGGGGGGGGGQQHPQRGGQQIIGGGTDRGGPHGQRGSKSTSSMSGGQHAVAAGAVSQGTSGHVVSGSMMTHKGQETKGGGGVAGGGRPLGVSGQQQHLQTTPQSATQGAMAEAGSRLPVSGQRRGSGLAVGGQLSSSSPSSSTAQPHHLHGAMLSHDTQQHAQQANMIGGGGGAGSQGGPYAAKPQQQGQQHLVGAKTQQLGGPEQISSSLSSSSSSPGAGRQGLMVMSSTQAGAFSTNQTAQKQRQPQARTAAAPGTQSSPGQYQQHPMQRSSSSHQLQSADLVSSSSQNIKDLQKRGSADPHQPQQQQFLVGTERGVPAKAFRQQPQQQPQQQAVGASPMLAQQPSVGVAGAGVYAPEHGKAGLAGQAGIPLSSATSNTQSLAMLNHTSQQPMQHPPQHRDFSLPTGGVGGSQLPAYQQNSHRSMDIQGQRNSGGAGENFKRRQSMMEASHVAGGGIGGAGTTQGHDEMVLRPQLAGRSASMTNVEGGGGWTAATGVEGSQAGAVASQPVITAQQGGGLQTAVQVGGGGGQQMPVRAQQWGGGGQPQAGPPPLSSVQPAPETLVEEVIKSPDILANILSSRWSDMQDWPEEQRRQVLSLQAALVRRGFVLAQ